MLKLYYEDFIAQWDGFLHDVTLAPLIDLPTATEQPQGPRQRRLGAEAAADRGGRRDRPRPARGQPARPPAAAPPKGVSKVLGKLGKLGKLAKKGAKFVPAGEGARRSTPPARRSPTTSSRSAAAIAEVDGAPPALDAAVAALTALSNVLQTVSASPDPERRSRTRAASPS